MTRALSNDKLRSPKTNLGMQVPQQLMGDVHQKITERLALLGSVGWQNSSRFGQVDISIDTANPKSMK